MPEPPEAALIRIRAATVRFGTQEVLRDLSLDIHRGETVAVIGESGCGKTCLLKMIVGLEVNAAARPLSPYQALAADFDGDGVVGLTDAIAVLRHVVGLSAPEPTWLFANEIDPGVPGRANLSPGRAPAIHADLGASSPVHVGLVGYLRGDVDGSYAGAPTAQSLDLSQPGYFSALVETHPGLSLAQFGVYP